MTTMRAFPLRLVTGATPERVRRAACSVPARERIARLGEQGGERGRADPGQGAEDRRIARTVCRRGGILAQPGAELVAFPLGLAELGIGQAQIGRASCRERV